MEHMGLTVLTVRPVQLKSMIYYILIAYIFEGAMPKIWKDILGVSKKCTSLETIFPTLGTDKQ